MISNLWGRIYNSHITSMRTSLRTAMSAAGTAPFIGASIGASYGLISSNEGRGPIAGTIIYGGLGLAVGLAGYELSRRLPGIRSGIRNIHGFMNRPANEWNGPARSSMMENMRTAGLSGSVSDIIASANIESGVTGTSPLVRSTIKGADELQGNIFTWLAPHAGISLDSLESWDDLVNAFHSAKGTPSYAIRMGVLMGREESRKFMSPMLSAGSLKAFNEGVEKIGSWGDLIDMINGLDPAEFQSKEILMNNIQRRMRQYNRSGMTRLIGPEQLGLQKTATIAPYSNLNKDDIINKLRAQGAGDLASEIEAMDTSIGVSAFWKEGSVAGAISELKLSTPVGGDISVPVLMNDIIREGPAGRNIYNVRRQVFFGDLLEATSAKMRGEVGALKGTYSADVWAAKMVNAYYGNIASNMRGDLVEYIDQTLRSAKSFDYSPLRSFRNQLTVNPIQGMIRRNQVQVNLPSYDIAVALGMSKEAPFLNQMGMFEGDLIHRVLWSSGFAHMGTEHGAAAGTFENVMNVLNFSFGAFEQPLEKPIRSLRDLTKPYFTRFEGPGANITHLPVATSLERKMLRGREPLVARIYGTTAEERVFLRDLLTIHERVYNGGKFIKSNMPLVLAYNPESPMLAGLSAAERIRLARNVLGRPRSNSSFREALRAISETEEGIGAFAIGSRTSMVSMRDIAVDFADPKMVMDQLSSELRDKIINGSISKQELISAFKGKWVQRNSNFGLRLGNREVVSGTYEDASKGSMFIEDVIPHGRGFVFKVREEYPEELSKVGFIAGKVENKPWDPRVVNEVLDFFEGLRTNKRFSSLSANQSMAATSFFRDPNVITGFMPIESLGKVSSQGEANLFQIISTLAQPGTIVKGRPNIRMHPKGIRSLRKSLKEVGIRSKYVGHTGLEVTPTLPSNLSDAEVYAYRTRQFERIYELTEDILFNPQKYFDTGGISNFTFWERSGLIRMNQAQRMKYRPSSLKRMSISERRGAASAIMNSMGIVSTIHPWNTLESGLPNQAGFTYLEYQMMNQFGWKKTAQAMLARRGIRGDLDVSARFYDTLQRETMYGYKGATLTANQVKTYGMSDIQPITANRVGQQLEHWRYLKAFEDNFVVDLSVAQGVTAEAMEAVRKAFDYNTQILVPGSRSDLWNIAFETPKSGVVQSGTALVQPLEGVFKNVERFYRSGGKDAASLERAVTHYKEYRKTVYSVMGNLFTGRGGSTPDMGAWVGGIITYRPYRSKFKDVVGEYTASRIMGVSPERYKALRSQGAHAVTIGGQEFLLGWNKRYPISSVDPTLVIMDERLAKMHGKHAIAMDEAHRYVKHMDFDGDMVIAHLMMKSDDAGAIEELMGALSQKGSAYAAYEEFLRQGIHFGGLEDEFTRRAKIGKMYSVDAAEAWAKRVNEKMRYLNESDAIPEMMAKYFTSRIGEFSNLSKSISIMAAGMDYIGDAASVLRARTIRTTLADALQQVAIDFARVRKAGLRPGDIASRIRDAIGLAKIGHLQDANQKMYDMLNQLGILKDQEERFEAQSKLIASIPTIEKELQTAGLSTDRRASLQLTLKEARELSQNFEGMKTAWNEATSNLFTLTSDPRRLAKFGDIAEAVLKKGENLTGGDLGKLQSQFNELVGNLALGGEEGMLAAMGKIESRMRISAVNQGYKEAAAAYRHIREGLGGFFKSPAGRGAAIAGGIALGAAALYGALKPVGDMSAPSADSYGATSIQRTPDAAMVGADGEAPLPGSRGGNVGYRNKTEYVGSRATPVNMHSRRMYVQQSNRIPRVNTRTSGEFGQYNQAAEVSWRTGSAVGGAHTNIVTSPGARRRSRQEVEGNLRDEMLR